MEDSCTINVEWGAIFAEWLGGLLSDAILIVVCGAFPAGGLLFYVFLCRRQWIPRDSLFLDYVGIMATILLALILNLVITRHMESISDFWEKLFSRRVRVYLNGTLVASGKANFEFYVPLSRPGDVYEVKWGKETFPLRLYPGKDYCFSKGDSEWEYHEWPSL